MFLVYHDYRVSGPPKEAVLCLSACQAVPVEEHPRVSSRELQLASELVEICLVPRNTGALYAHILRLRSLGMFGSSLPNKGFMTIT